MSDKQIQKIQDAVLSLYLKDFQLLKSMKVNPKIVSGEFQVPEKTYTVANNRALSAARQVILFNQIAIVGSAANFILGNWDDKSDYKLQCNESHIKDYAKDIVIQKFNHLTYKKMVTPNSPMQYELEFKKIIDKYQSRGLIFFEAELRINGNEQTGSGTYCLWHDKSAYLNEQAKIG